MPTEASAAQQSSENTNAAGSGRLTAGEVLQQERLRRGLSEKEIADKLHITVHYVKSIESNSYEKLPGAIFAKGYIKSYALLLGMDEDEMVVMYDSYQKQQQAEKDDDSRLRARRKKDRNRPWVIVSVVAFIGGFAGLWAYNNYFTEEAVNSIEPEEATNQQAITLRQQGSTDPVAPAVNTTPARIESVTQPAGQPVIAADTVYSIASSPASVEAERELTVAQDFASALSILAVEDETGREAEVEDVAATTTTTTTTTTTDSASQLIEIGAAGSDVLRISFSGESWIEVNDSKSNQIYRDIRDAGDVLEITGNAPFSILLGDAPFTSMSLNGTEIDVSENIRIDNSARLTVGL